VSHAASQQHGFWKHKTSSPGTWRRSIAAYGSPHLPGPSEVWLDLRAVFLLEAGTQGTNGKKDWRRPVPNVPGFVGLELSYQAVTGRAPILTNAATVVLFDR